MADAARLFEISAQIKTNPTEILALSSWPMDLFYLTMKFSISICESARCALMSTDWLKWNSKISSWNRLTFDYQKRFRNVTLANWHILHLHKLCVKFFDGALSLIWSAKRKKDDAKGRKIAAIWIPKKKPINQINND